MQEGEGILWDRPDASSAKLDGRTVIAYSLDCDPTPDSCHDRVSDLFKLNGVQARFALLDGMALKKSGYVLVSGPLPADVDPADFTVDNSRLAIRSGARTRSLDAIDYCLIAIEQKDSLFPNDGDGNAELRALAGLPFHSYWQKVASLLAARKPDDAEQALLVLRAEVISSPDLTENDRLLAIGGYDVAYTKFAGSLLAKPAMPPKRRADSGARHRSPALRPRRRKDKGATRRRPRRWTRSFVICSGPPVEMAAGMTSRRPMQCSRGRSVRCASH